MIDYEVGAWWVIPLLLYAFYRIIKWIIVKTTKSEEAGNRFANFMENSLDFFLEKIRPILIVVIIAFWVIIIVKFIILD